MKVIHVPTSTAYQSDKLPAGIDADDCVSAAEWFAQNRTDGEGGPAESAGGDKAIADMTGPELNELIDELGLDVKKSGKVAARAKAVAEAVAELEPLVGLDPDELAALNEEGGDEGNAD